MLVRTGGKIRFYAWDGAWIYAQSDSDIPLNTWAQLVGTRDGTTVKLYVNGQLQTTTGTSGSINYNSASMGRIGVYNNNFDGIIDEVRILNGTRNAYPTRHTRLATTAFRDISIGLSSWGG